MGLGENENRLSTVASQVELDHSLQALITDRQVLCTQIHHRFWRRSG